MNRARPMAARLKKQKKKQEDLRSYNRAFKT